MRTLPAPQYYSLQETNFVKFEIFRKPPRSHLLIEQPGGREYQWDVENHVDHAGPVDGQGGHAVVFLQDAGDDDQLGPLEGVGSRVEDEHGQHRPSDGVDGVHLGLGHLLLSQLRYQYE